MAATKKTIKLFVEEQEDNDVLEVCDGLNKIAPKTIGKLDMVIAFDTTGSMASYIGSVRKDVSLLIPQLFKDNEDLRLGLVAFGDYCDMIDKDNFGDAYQVLMPTDNENDLVKFVLNSRDTSGGDGDEFYELVLKKIVEETPWRPDSKRVVLLIADAEPHGLGYSYGDIVQGNQIDWRQVAHRAAEMKIKIDTVTIGRSGWYKELSGMTNGVSVPFSTDTNTSDLIRASVWARGSSASREKFDEMRKNISDPETMSFFAAYECERNEED